MSRITRGIATLSWIDPATGLPEVDSAGDPGSIVSYSRIISESGYRFSNFLEAWLEVDTTAGAGAIIGANYSAASGMYRGPSFLGLASAPVGNIGRTINRTPNAVTFRQLVGCRTESPEKIGRGVGAFGGGLAGVFVPVPGAPIVGQYVGSKVGHGTAQEVKAFPPIWTELELTINIDGTFTHKLQRHSLFPSVSYYAQVVTSGGYVVPGSYSRQGPSYDAVPMLNPWYEGGWGFAGRGPITGRPGSAPTPGNPWGMTKATFTTDSSLSAKPAGY